MWYGTPFISSDNMLVMTVNSVGAVFQLIYITLFIVYAEKLKKVVYYLKNIHALVTVMKFLKDFCVILSCHSLSLLNVAGRLGCLDCCWQCLGYVQS